MAEQQGNTTRPKILLKKRELDHNVEAKIVKQAAEGRCAFCAVKEKPIWQMLTLKKDNTGFLQFLTCMRCYETHEGGVIKQAFEGKALLIDNI